MRAFRMAVDAHRTLVPLSYPPHAIAAACLFLTSFLTAEFSVPGAPAFEAGWENRCLCDIEDIEGAAAHSQRKGHRQADKKVFQTYAIASWTCCWRSDRRRKPHLQTRSSPLCSRLAKACH